MNHKKKNFIYKNEAFVCDFCGEDNPINKPEIRNHCRKCLCSKHVDEVVPGDRLSGCMGKMAPLRAYYTKKKGYMVEVECLKCGKKSVNKLASDDNYELAGQLSAPNM